MTNSIHVNHIINKYFEWDYTLMNLEDKDGTTLCQVLIAPDVDIEDVWDHFCELFPQAENVCTVDDTHRDDCPLYSIQNNNQFSLSTNHLLNEDTPYYIIQINTNA